jgi:hypothetical protein
MNDLTEITDGPGDTSVYRWCLTAYPPKYRSEHGEDILATIKDAHGDQSRASLLECTALIVGGVRRRAAEAAADGPVKALFSALRGAAVILLLSNAAVEITGIVHHWTAPRVPIPHLWVAIYLGTPNGEGIGALMWAGAILSVFAVALLGAGFRRWSGFALLASGVSVAGAADWLTRLGVHNYTMLQAWGGVPFTAAFDSGGLSFQAVDFSLASTLLAPAALLMVLPASRNRVAYRRRGIVTACVALVVLVLGSVFIPWLGQNPGLALVVGVVAASALAPVDGRISLVASAVVLVYLPLLTRAPHSEDGLLPMSGAPWVPEILIIAVILAAWGWFWTDRRRAHPPAHLAN